MKPDRKSTKRFKKFFKEITRCAATQAPRTWVMVIDQHIARIFEKNGKVLEAIGEASPIRRRDRGLPINQ